MIQSKAVIIGAGFGGLFTARQLADKDVEVLLIDRNNYHLFTPLIYQVATCGLDVQDVAYPIRQIFAETDNVDFMLGEVTDIQADQKQIVVHTAGETRTVDYDYLVVAAGAVSNFFGNENVEKNGFALKNIDDAVRLRNHILKQYEAMDWSEGPQNFDALRTMVVVGGGPTGLETAGALHELYTHVLQKEYKPLRNLPARVVLVEAMDHVLAPYPKRLQESARKQLESMGVEVRLGELVKDVHEDRVILNSGEEIQTTMLVWAAGVKASPLARMLDVELARGGRIPVKSSLETVQLEQVYAIGDIAYLEDENGRPYAQQIPVAQQQAKLVAENLIARINGEDEKPFKFVDKGTMATIGRRRAVAWIFNKVQLSGYIAWLGWLGLHLITLLGFRNRLSVFVNWIWNYMTYDRAARVIMEYPKSHKLVAMAEPQPEREPEPQPRTTS
ncbi:MAG: NAD(P)/FAD-dependent oxidoreductase [Chloroflexota bacterium]